MMSSSAISCYVSLHVARTTDDCEVMTGALPFLDGRAGVVE